MLVDANLNPSLPPFVFGGLQYAPNIEDIMSDSDLLALGLYRVVDVPVTDPTLIVTGSTIVKETDGSVHRVYQTTPVPTPAQSDLITAERDRRMYGGFVFDEIVYQSDAVAITNILGAAQLASLAVIAGAKTGDLRWANSNQDFVWIATNNTTTPMDAQTTIAFAQAAAAFRSQLIYAARSLKNAVIAGQTVDIYADASWGMDSTSPTSTAKTS
jgi:hypothetical protein